MEAGRALSAPVKPQADRHDIEQFLEAKRRAMEPKTTTDIIDSVLVELQRQIEPLLEVSRLRILPQEDIDRLVQLNGAVLAIHRALGPGDLDPTQATEAELRKAAK